MSKLQTIIDLLPQLSAEELNSVSSRISALRNISSPRSMDNDENWALQCVCDVLASIGVEYPLVGTLQKVIDRPTFRVKLVEINHFFNKSKLNRIERRAVLMIGIELLYTNMQEIGIPVSSRTLILQFHRIPAILNKNFPGYASCGFLGMLITR